MAPPPEYDKEPKAPDKSAYNISCEETKALNNLVNDQQNISDSITASSSASAEAENKHVETLDDGALRALLDEAITYKCPKDREGKSSLFKELLEEVEQDEQACEAAARNLNVGRRQRNSRGGSSRHSVAQSNSLQDLVAALAAEPTPRRHHSHRHHNTPPATTVSARALHGGSLPSGVDTSFLLGEEGSAPRGANYLATVRCVNPPPLGERRVSASDAPQDDNNRRSKPAYPMTYTARATLEIGSGGGGGGGGGGSSGTARAITTTTASNQVDSSIPFSCITTPKVVPGCNTTSSSTQSAVAVDSKPLQLGWSYRAVSSLTGGTPEAAGGAESVASTSSTQHMQPRSVISSSFNGLSLSRPNYGTMSANTEEYKKPLDENGNSVNSAFSTPLLSGSSQHKKPRRKKSSKNEVVIKSHQIDGYQGNKDLNEVLRFIESNADAPRGNGPKLRKARHEDEDKPKKRERRKDKQPPQRAASLEEIAVSSLRELTTSRPPPAKPERRSWGDDFRPEDEASPGEFQTVTKKRRWRRRETPAPAPPAARARRVSAPPSDRSDSNDDDSLHSLHSLPALNAGESARAPASYADIARAANIPDLIESCNYYTEEPRPPPPPPHDDYPALEPRRRAVATNPTAAVVAAKPPSSTAHRRDKKERTEITSTSVPAECLACPAPDVVSEGRTRPPVILLDSARHNDIDGITFGFDINHQLLSGSRGRGCDLVRDAVEGGSDADAEELDTTPEEATDEVPAEAETEATEAESIARAEGAEKHINTVRYLPPTYTPLTPHLVQIIDYVAQAWDEVMRCGGGRVRYFTE